MKQAFIALVIGIGLIGVVVFVTKSRSDDDIQVNTSIQKEMGANNVQIIDGKQIIEINARGGYTPKSSVAKAGIPTVVRFNTTGTFDCSSSVRIPSMNISQILPQTGTTDIDLGIPQKGPLSGSCGMGMYPFDITFTE